MISMQQLEELENRVVKALQLISDLRTENSKLENENEEIKGELEETKLSLEEKEQEIERIRKELDHATIELEELNAKEEVLEKKVIALLGKLDGLSAGGGIPTGDRIERKTPPPSGSSGIRAKQKPSKFDDNEVDLDGLTEEDVKVETVDSKDTVDIDEDEDIIIIDDESDLSSKSGEGIALETVPDTDDDIILLDEKDEEIIIEDVDKDKMIIDEGDKSRKGGKKQKAKPKANDDDFLIIEEDDK